jgi:hypothetical protein
MSRFKFREELSRRLHPTLSHILKALADTFFRVSLGGNVQQPLVGLGILHDSSGLSFHGQYHGTLTLLELPQELSGTAAECRERLDVFRDVKHRPAFI